MKLSKLILKILAISLAVSAFACVMLIFWEDMAALFAACVEKTKSCCRFPDEYEDFADV